MTEVTMDQSGKVEIPEIIRKCLGLNPGSKLEIVMGLLGEIRLHAIPEHNDEAQTQQEVNETKSHKLVRKNGVLVVRTEQNDDYLKYYLKHAVELDREARMRKVMGELT